MAHIWFYKMSILFSIMKHVILPKVIENHISNNIKLNTISSIKIQWNKKFNSFLNLVEKNSLDVVDYVNIEDKSGILLFTYSGSLILISPLENDNRWLEYSGLEERINVPNIISEDNVKILTDIYIDRRVYFDAILLKNTSPIFKIATY